jgi:SAM-dependent methyltransferase
MRLLKPLFERMFDAAEAANLANILRLCDGVRAESLLDLGCDDGGWTLELARAANAVRVEGVEIVPEAAAAARAKGIEVHELDLNRALPLPDGAYDLVHANQVIEHVADVDLFAAEVFRLLKPGGVAIVSTENGSSWHNVFAAAMGWQIFSLTNVSGKVAGLGNPLAIQRGAEAFSPTWRHKTIMNYRGLKELFELHGFRDVKISGAGYYPLPPSVGRFDPRHSVYITVTGRR